MESFRSALEDCQLGDLGFRGSKYTWTNCRETAYFMKERLDRAVANAEWCTQFQEIDVSILAALSSDHKPKASSTSSPIQVEAIGAAMRLARRWSGMRG